MSIVLYALVTGLCSLAGVVLGYRLGCQRIVRQEVRLEDSGPLPAPRSPTQEAKEWRRTHVPLKDSAHR